MGKIEQKRRYTRRTLAGAVLRPLGYSYSRLELTDEGNDLFDSSRRRIAFAELASPAMAKKAFRFSSVVIPLKDGAGIVVADLSHPDAVLFIHAAGFAHKHLPN